MAEAGPRITTIIPTYRRPQMLEQAIRSVLCQTVGDFQVCIYDNASGDDTGEVVRRLQQQDSRIQYHCHAENIGMIPNFNYGVARVDTPYFSVLSDDDLLLPRFYETALRGFSRHSEAMASSGTVVLTTLDGTLARRGPCLKEEGYFVPPEGILAWTHKSKPMITANLFRRETIEAVGLFSEKGYTDHDWELRLAARFPYAVCCTPCAVITMHEEHGTKGFRTEAGLWWEAYAVIEASLRQVAELPETVREKALDNLKREFGQRVYQMGLMLMSHRQYQMMETAASVLRERFEMAAEAERLCRLAAWSEKLQPLHFLFALRRGIRNMRERRQNRDLGRRLVAYRASPHADFAV